MDEKIQDRIDDFLLNRMNDTDKQSFLHEVENDSDKKEQLDFTENVKKAVCSRAEKLNATVEFQRRYNKEKTFVPSPTAAARECTTKDRHKKRVWIWFSALAAVLVIGFFSLEPMFRNEYGSSPNEQIRGDEDIFDVVTDTVNKDTLSTDKDSSAFSRE